jgi:hypothetical protein
MYKTSLIRKTKKQQHQNYDKYCWRILMMTTQMLNITQLYCKYIQYHYRHVSWEMARY